MKDNWGLCVVMGYGAYMERVRQWSLVGRRREGLVGFEFDG